MKQDFDFKGEMAVNVKWFGLSQLSTYLIQFIVWVVLARLLPPDGFGALGIALAFSNLVFIFGELGMSSAVIQRQNVTPQHLTTAFWTGIGLTSGFFVLALAAARSLADFFHNPDISGLLVLFALKLVVDSGGAVHEVLLKKHLSFKRLTVIEVSTSVLFGVAAVVLALRGFGIRSLAMGYLVKSVLKTVLLWQKVSFRPGWEFHRKSFRELFSFGKNIIGFKIMSYFSGNIDIFLIGKFLGPAALGYYSLALTLVNFPRQKLSQILSQVAFPAFSKIQDRKEEVQNAYRKLIRYASTVSFPLLAGLALLAVPFVRMVYTAKWEPMVFSLQALCLYGLFFSITTFVGIVYNAMGSPQRSFHFSLTQLLLTAAAVVAGLPYGLTGVALALSVVALLLNILGQFFVKQLIGLSYREYAGALIPAGICSSIMAAVLYVAAGWLRGAGFSDTQQVLTLVPLGALSYIAGLCCVGRDTVAELTGVFKRMMH